MMDAELMNGSIYGSIVNVSGVPGCAVLARVLRSAHVEGERLIMPNITLLHFTNPGACPSAKRPWKELR